MEEKAQPVGQLFSMIYCDRDVPIRDSEYFRRRIGSFCQTELDEYHPELAKFLTHETGIPIENYHYYYKIEDFFLKIEPVRMLNAITLVWRFLGTKDAIKLKSWYDFVQRTLREENLSYRIDEQCGVHYLIDDEFNRNKVSALKCLERAKYAGVKAAFEDAHRHLDSSDTKASVRSIFESLEIIIRQMVETQNLNRFAVEKLLKPLVLERDKSDNTALNSIERVFNGFAQWVDGMHFYRHGQGEQEPTAPPIEFAVFVLSSGASYLRWLVDIDSIVNQQE
jgi:hypothetical protein